MFGIRRHATLLYQYDELQYISDAVTRSIAWPSSKVVAIPVCFLHTACLLYLLCRLRIILLDEVLQAWSVCLIPPLRHGQNCYQGAGMDT